MALVESYALLLTSGTLWKGRYSDSLPAFGQSEDAETAGWLEPCAFDLSGVANACLPKQGKQFAASQRTGTQFFVVDMAILHHQQRLAFKSLLKSWMPVQDRNGRPV